jgi:hypothetical protein
MRAGVVAVLVGAVLALAPAASAKEGPFLDLPGIGAVERLTDAKAAPTVSDGVSGTTTTQRITETDRMPAPDPTKAASAADAADAAVTPADDTAMIRSLPGGNHLPVLGVDAAASRGNAGMLFALALMVVVLFTRFLFRLNTLGRPA